MNGYENPLLTPDTDPVVDLTAGSPDVFKRRKRDVKREMVYLRRKETARDALAGFDRDTEIFIFTKGQFSLMDVLDAALDVTGPADAAVSTWTASQDNVADVVKFLESGKMKSCRWLVDLSFHRREPEISQRIRSVFGYDSIRVGQNHAKFALLKNETWKVAVRTTMNLNNNPRFENCTIAHDPELHDFIEGVLDRIWNRQKAGLHEQPLSESLRSFREI